MKLTLLAVLAMAISAPIIRAEDVIEDAMKKFHKGETATCKKVSGGTASDAELADILKSYQAMCGAKPPQGTASSWTEKCKALIAAVKKIQSKDASGIADYKKAVNCKACHEVHKPKK
jgi:hypothetical protein